MYVCMCVYTYIYIYIYIHNMYTDLAEILQSKTMCRKRQHLHRCARPVFKSSIWEKWAQPLGDLNFHRAF